MYLASVTTVIHIRYVLTTVTSVEGRALPGRVVLKHGMLRPAFASRRQPLHHEASSANKF